MFVEIQMVINQFNDDIKNKTYSSVAFLDISQGEYMTRKSIVKIDTILLSISNHIPGKL